MAAAEGDASHINEAGDPLALQQVEEPIGAMVAVADCPQRGGGGDGAVRGGSGIIQATPSSTATATSLPLWRRSMRMFSSGACEFVSALAIGSHIEGIPKSFVK